jgi:hypothetical protein
MRKFAAFFQDNWNIGSRLVVSWGIRYERNQGYQNDQPQPDGEVLKGVGVYHTFNSWSPRISLNYNLTADGKTMFRTSFGQYGDAVRTGLFSSRNNARTPSIAAYEIGGYKSGIWYPYSIYTGYAYEWDPNLKNSWMRIFTVSLERQVFKNALLSMQYIKKWAGNLLGSMPLNTFVPVTVLDSYTGEMVNMWKRVEYEQKWYFTNLNTSDYDLTFSFDAFQLGFRKRYSNRWMLDISYHYERTWGTSDNAYNRMYGGSMQMGGIRITPNTKINWEGPLTYNRPHQLKVTAAYNGPWGINLSTFIEWYSGLAWNRILSVYDYDAGIYGEIINAEPRGTRREPQHINIDVMLQKAFRFAASAHLVFSLQVKNVLNRAGVTYIYSYSGSANMDEMFGQAQGFQPPRIYRLGVKFQF